MWLFMSDAVRLLPGGSAGRDLVQHPHLRHPGLRARPDAGPVQRDLPDDVQPGHDHRSGGGGGVLGVRPGAGHHHRHDGHHYI